MNAKSLARSLAGKLGNKDAILLLAAELLRHVDMNKVTAISQALRGMTGMDNEERIANRVARRMMAAPKLESVLGEFYKLQSKYREYGATDSEPRHFFEYLMEQAIAGKPFPSVSPGDWQIFSSMAGWKRVANSLTKKAQKVYQKIQNAPHVEVMALAKYYGWD